MHTARRRIAIVQARSHPACDELVVLCATARRQCASAIASGLVFSRACAALVPACPLQTRLAVSISSWLRVSSCLCSIVAIACGSAARDNPTTNDEQEQGAESDDTAATDETPPADDDSSNDSSRDDAEQRAAAAAPIAGVSKLATLPNRDTLTIPIDHELVQRQGTDSLVGELLDAAGERVCYYDIGAFSISITETNGTRDQAVNEVFYYRQEPGSEGAADAWQARFNERGPAFIECTSPLTRDEFLGLLRTYTATSPSPWRG